MRQETTISWPVSIFIAGDHEAATRICREFCNEIGLCVTVTPTTYVYTGGEEEGVIVGLINYPRFPALPHEINEVAEQLALRLKDGLGQGSFTIQDPHSARWRSWRPGDQL
jgi:hypothetical protein